MAFLRTLLLAFALLLAPAAHAQEGDSGWLYRGSDIAPDPAWRFGTLDNGMHYAVRRNPLPPGQVSIRLRIGVGALHEEESEQGWAHFVEHLMFRGTENYPGRQARHIWQQLGASFGSDTNARVDSTDTVYELNLPHATREALDTSLSVLADMMARATFAPEAVEAERPVIFSERRRRSELSVQSVELAQRIFYAGLRFGRRNGIGTDETLNAATAENLRAFYRRWYRPERATIVMVGDADPAMMEELIRMRFGGWEGEGADPADPDFGAIAGPPAPVANLPYPGVSTAMSLVWLRPYEARPHTAERERLYLEEGLAARIINRRLEAHARGDQAAYINAAIGVSRARAVAETTTLAVSARNNGWEAALAEAYAIVGDALRAPPSEAEIARELANLRTGARAAVQGESTVPSQVHAERLIGAIDNGSVVATAPTVLERFEANAAEMSPERIAEAMRRLFTGSGPRMILTTPEPVPDAALAQGLAAARAAAPAVRRAERVVSFDDLPRPGPPGEETARGRIEDMDVTIVRFANGSTLTHKRNDFERGTVHVRLRFGQGMSGLDPDRPSLAWLSGLVAASGIADFDLDAMERLMTGRRLGLSFGVEEDAFVLSGRTHAAELEDQLRLLAAKLTHPRWDAALLERFRTAAVESFDLHASSASARASREVAGFVRPDDERWRPIEKAEIAAVTIEDLRGFFEPKLRFGPVHAIVVGDVELDAAVEAMRTTVAALPHRPEAQPQARRFAVRPPAPSPQPATFTHNGDPTQSYAMIGWSTLGGRERTRERRALSLAANMLRARLFDRLREEEGATYSPSAVHLGSETFPDWGVLYVSAEIRPESADTFFRVARETVADLAARPALPDEFARAQNPVLSGIERRLATNGYWVEALENWHHSEEEIANTRSYLDDYRALTAEDVRAAVARWVADSGDWSMLVLPARVRTQDPQRP